jgi:hypothetical protein
MAAIRRNILADETAPKNDLQGVKLLKQEQLGPTTADLSIPGPSVPVSTYDLLVWWHHVAMDTFTPPTQADRNAAHARAASWLVVALLVGIVGCTHQAGTPPSRSSTTTTPPAATLRAQPNGVARRLRLPAGPVAAQFAIQAPAPPSHTFTVRILAPQDADVAVWLQTWYGSGWTCWPAPTTASGASREPHRPSACCGSPAWKRSAPEPGSSTPPSGHPDQRSSRSPSPSNPEPDRRSKEGRSSRQEPRAPAAPPRDHPRVAIHSA